MKNVDLANYTWHKALEELYKCYLLYVEPINIVLKHNDIHVQRIDFKEVSDMESILDKISINDINIEQIDNINAFFFWSSLRSLREKEIEYCINASIFFQAMMEAVINEEWIKGWFITKKWKDKSFYDKWFDYMKENWADKKEVGYFENYNDNIYKNIRINSIHPKWRDGLKHADNFDFYTVYENIKYWWFCFVFLLNKKHNFYLNYNDNWGEMCKRNCLEWDLEKNNFVDIEKLSAELYKKHICWINKNL